jgi:hypothetical protein
MFIRYNNFGKIIHLFDPTQILNVFHVLYSELKKA